ncbi:MAG: OmpA family protein [Chloroflexota bacterium]
MLRKSLFAILIMAALTSAAFARTEWASKVVDFSWQYSPTQYSANQVLGPPSVSANFGESPTAWRARPASEGVQFIVVEFATAIFAEQVSVSENLNPGAITQIILMDSLQTASQRVYQNVTPVVVQHEGRMMNAFFDRTPFPVKYARIELSTISYTEHYQVDAIGVSDNKTPVGYEINLLPVENVKSTPENLGENVNSEWHELAPVISPDGKTLYFTRELHPQNIGSEKLQDVWVSYMDDSTGKFGPAINIGPPINNEHSNFAAAITPGGNTMLLGNIYVPGGGMSRGLSMSEFNGTEWSFPKPLLIKNYKNLQKSTSSSLSASGKVLIISIGGEDSYGGNDLYVSFLEDDGTWSEPRNLGSRINTAGDEVTPFIAADEQTLYFSTNGRLGYGSNDMFISRRLDSTWTKWSEPQNLGPLFNTADWDAYYTITAKGDYAYFVSTQKSFGREDIFRIFVPEKARPQSVTLVRGKVLNQKTKQPVEATITYETLPEGTEVGKIRSNPKTGEYQIALPYGKRYGFLAHAEGFVAVNENVDLRNLKTYSEINRDLVLAPIEKGQTVRINNIFFEFAKYQLLEESFVELKRLRDLLDENPGMTIQITGHTDDVGPADGNQKLSLMRAQAVADYLVKLGVNRMRLKVAGMGESKPVGNNSTEEGRARNRRVEFTITGK